MSRSPKKQRKRLKTFVERDHGFKWRIEQNNEVMRLTSITLPSQFDKQAQYPSSSIIIYSSFYLLRSNPSTSLLFLRPST